MNKNYKGKYTRTTFKTLRPGDIIRGWGKPDTDTLVIKIDSNTGVFEDLSGARHTWEFQLSWHVQVRTPRPL